MSKRKVELNVDRFWRGGLNVDTQSGELSYKYLNNSYRKFNFFDIKTHLVSIRHKTLLFLLRCWYTVLRHQIFSHMLVHGVNEPNIFSYVGTRF